MNSLPQLNFPKFSFRILCDEGGGSCRIWDGIRRQWLVITPEEWVRQNFIRYMVEHRGVSPGHVSQEYPVQLNKTQQRADIVIFGASLEPLMLIECKCPDVEITEKVFRQAVRYNSVIKARYVVVTNGLRHLCCTLDAETGRYGSMVELPDLANFFK